MKTLIALTFIAFGLLGGTLLTGTAATAATWQEDVFAPKGP